MTHHTPARTSTRTRTRTGAVLATAAALLAAGLGTGGPAAAAPGTSRLPSLAEVAEIYPFLAEDGERAVTTARGIASPEPTDTDGGGGGCNDDRTVVRGVTGRSATYQDADAPPRQFTLPTVQVVRFASADAARGAFTRIERRVAACQGGFPRRDGGIDRRSVESPRFGQARVAYRETDRYFSGPYLFTHRIVVLRDNRVIVTTRSRGGEQGPPPRTQLEKLTWLALRTL